MNIKSWGTTVTPKKDWIDPAKTYTCGGHPVTDLRVVLHNSVEAEVTYPVKGRVLVRECPRRVWQNRIWSLDGRADVVWGKGDDLILEVLG